ncbi:MAG: AAA family ATPase [Muribaculaceae bacterium]|nr:AAA family ATPase [Muribaculaceae bacterium]
MIQDFRVSNFFSIRKEQAISFVPSPDTSYIDDYTFEVKPGLKLLKLGIIYGANASGKSTILNALDYFRKIMTTRPDDKLAGMDFLPFMLDDKSRNDKSSMKISFYIEGERYILSCLFDRQRIYEEELIVYTSSRPTVLYRRNYNEQTDHSEIAFGNKAGLCKSSRDVIEGNTLNNCSVIAAIGQSNVERTHLTKVYEYFATSMMETLTPRMDAMSFAKDLLQSEISKELKNFILKLLRASDFNITDIKIKNSNQLKELLFTHAGDDGSYELNEQVESAGTKRYMGMAILLYNLLHHNCFIPIDEVEASIHYELLSYFIKLFLVNSAGTSQLLMTTHDINLLDEDFIRRDVVWFTDKNSAGATELKRLSGLGLHKTMSPYNAYTQGKLVKLPFTESIYLYPDKTI